MISRIHEETKFLQEFCTNRYDLLHPKDLKFFREYYGVLPDYFIKYLAIEHGMIENFVETKVTENVEGFTISHGLSSHSYDLRLDKAKDFKKKFTLGSSVERFVLPPFIQVELVNKSTMVRLGVWQPGTIAEIGWKGYLTLELFYAKNRTPQNSLDLFENKGIASLRFFKVPIPCEVYKGKYQNQPKIPVEAR